ncbi:helix-turn-helix transcriptional regulator [Burkholderia orbicola]|uniref:helix-turn-helix transcriptional regulator n=1 Tax=Burkholderia cepacia complex TaxID=87882 RepID=UPI001CF2E25F|nr:MULTISPECIES: helix-turn-helix transcriptional regulator [Burkholderia cepacia complex]MCA8088274.1 helix-turn-helix transcriptional regulator [Burkholderia cenocepacia]MDN7466965.1 helix-turn-helix transcriptional regulator [Burkholderia orbicola]MDN7505866.1 helix-turn-helix transcriptional regulator [Burkholderia orbicola]
MRIGIVAVEGSLLSAINGLADLFWSFITRVRIEMACVLLERPGASIKQVALQCGYREETSFRRAFSQLTGMTPADYRRWSDGRNVRRLPSPHALETSDA